MRGKRSLGVGGVDWLGVEGRGGRESISSAAVVEWYASFTKITCVSPSSCVRISKSLRPVSRARSAVNVGESHEVVESCWSSSSCTVLSVVWNIIAKPLLPLTRRTKFRFLALLHCLPFSPLILCFSVCVSGVCAEGAWAWVLLERGWSGAT